MLENWQTRGFGIYIHWPFCAAKCPYCDFNSHVSRTIDHEAWTQAYLVELRHYAKETQGRTVSSIFFGGGTPSLMTPGTVQSVIDEISSLWHVANNIEITLEANPSSVDTVNFAEFRLAGVNRVSIGVQALNNHDLAKLGRLHSVSEALDALAVANKIFDRVSFDLIYARQDQSLSQWETELATAISLSTGHLSLYQLTIEPNTAFGDRFSRGKLPGLPEDDTSADMFFLTQDLCNCANIPAYEVSNHAELGNESRHNLIYWNSGDWLGIGPGAHGRISLGDQRFATTTPLSPASWLKDALAGNVSTRRKLLDITDQNSELLLMGLRTRNGVNLSHLIDYDLISDKNTELQHLRELGLVDISGSQLTLTEAGRPLLNAILRDILPD